MVAKDKASAKRKQPKDKEEAEKQEQKRSKQEEEQEQQEESEGEAEASGSGSEEEEEESSDGEPANTDIFEAELKEREEQLGKHCMVLGSLDEGEEEEDEEGEGGESDDEALKQPSIEKLRALARVFVPKKVQAYFAELADALNKIGAEDSEEDEDEEMDPAMKAMMAEAGWSFRMLSTRHSYDMHKLLQDSLAKADTAIKASKWEEAFCRWAAVVQAARRESHWFADTDVPATAEGIYEKMRQQWVKLQKHTDETWTLYCASTCNILQELGGLVCEGGAASVKEAFSSFLQALADDMKEMNFKVKDVVK